MFEPAGTEPDLTESAWRLAKDNMAGVYRSAPFSLAIGAASLLAGAVAGLVSFGGDSLQVAMTSVVAGLAAMLTCTAAVFAFEVSASPLRQRNELRRAWRHADRLSAPAIAIRLSDLARRGEDLLHGCRAAGYTALDQAAVDSWTTDVVDFLSAYCDSSQAAIFTRASRGTRQFIARLEKRIEALDEIVQGPAT